MLSNDHEEMRFLLKNRLPTNSDHFLFRHPQLYTPDKPRFPIIRVLVAVAILSAAIALWLGTLDAQALMDRLLWVK